MTAPIAAAAQNDAQRWRDWQNRGLEGDRHRTVVMRWVMAIIAIALGVLFGGLL